MKRSYMVIGYLTQDYALKQLAEEIQPRTDQPPLDFIIKPLKSFREEVRDPSQNYLQLRNRRGKGKR